MPIRSKEAGEILGISPVTVRAWCRDGKLEYETSVTGQRIFNKEYLEEYRREKLGLTTPKNVVFYARTSNNNDVTINTQINKLTQEYGQPNKVFTDKSSGLNENRPGLKQLIKYAKNNPNTTIYITNNDRLTRFGYTYLEELFRTNKCSIIVLDSKEIKEPHEVLMEDFMSLIASFSGKFYRIRGWKQQKRLLNKALTHIGEKHE